MRKNMPKTDSELEAMDAAFDAAARQLVLDIVAGKAGLVFEPTQPGQSLQYGFRLRIEPIITE